MALQSLPVAPVPLWATRSDHGATVALWATRSAPAAMHTHQGVAPVPPRATVFVAIPLYWPYGYSYLEVRLYTYGYEYIPRYSASLLRGKLSVRVIP